VNRDFDWRRRKKSDARTNETEKRDRGENIGGIM
jgi:hypothetical protein